MKVPVINIKGKTTGREVELSNKVFGIEPNDHAVYLDVKQFLSNQFLSIRWCFKLSKNVQSIITYNFYKDCMAVYGDFCILTAVK